MIARLFFSILLLTSLAACASGARSGAMTAPVTEATVISDTSSLKKAITVGDVTGGSETNPLWTSEVGSPEFKTALEQSLMLDAMYAAEKPKYRLDAQMLDIDQPIVGLDLTVDSHVRYRLTEIDTNELVYEREISCSYTANFSDAFLGVERLRLANEGTMKKNISLFIEELVREFKKRDAAAAAAPASTEDLAGAGT
ncbi:hypothetical protein [Parvibaculum sp.]|uniref:hypothetical protein n=1 Tax=Parvibaculum sp. TaxID=2024848 RepID=UPI0025FA68D4|nr:hypothetical protein [Parvibaculum sp.]